MVNDPIRLVLYLARQLWDVVTRNAHHNLKDAGFAQELENPLPGDLVAEISGIATADHRTHDWGKRVGRLIVVREEPYVGTDDAGKQFVGGPERVAYFECFDKSLVRLTNFHIVKVPERSFNEVLHGGFRPNNEEGKAKWVQKAIDRHGLNRKPRKVT